MQKSNKSDTGNVRVVSRFRPLNEREKDHSRDIIVKFLDEYTVEITSDSREQNSKERKNTFKFDRVFSMDSTQTEVYETAAKPIVESILEGFNGTIFTYGQTSSGKTYTMSGPDIYDPVQKGITPRMVRTIFDAIDQAPDNVEFTMKVGYAEIYLEKIKDLLNPAQSNLKIKEDNINGVYLQDQRLEYVSSEIEVFDFMQIGMNNREVGATQMNAGSSRSHSIFCLDITQMQTDTMSALNGKLYLVDLAGSEKISKTGAEGKRLDEAKNINKSLTMLGIVINALTDSKSTHIPYRDSKLTRMLQNSLGGNSKTTLIITCSPSTFNAAETLSTLRFGERAKSIKNQPKVNRQQTVAELKLLLEQAEKEIEKRGLRIESLEQIIKSLQNTNQIENVQEIIQKIDFFSQQSPQDVKAAESDSDKSVDFFEDPNVSEEIKQYIEFLNEQLEQQKAHSEAEHYRSESLQKELLNNNARLQSLEKENDALIMRINSLAMDKTDLEEELQEIKEENQRILEQNQRLKQDLQFIQTTQQQPPQKKLHSKQTSTATTAAFMNSESKEVCDVYVQSDEQFLSELNSFKHENEVLQAELNKALSGELPSIKTAFEKIKQEERKKFEFEKTQILQDLDASTQRCMQLDIKLRDLQEKYNSLWQSKGDKELRKKQIKLEKQVESLSTMYHQNIRKISEIKVKKKLYKKRLLRKEDKIVQLEKIYKEACQTIKDLKNKLDQIEPQSALYQLPGINQNTNLRLVKKIRGGNASRKASQFNLSAALDFQDNQFPQNLTDRGKPPHH